MVRDTRFYDRLGGQFTSPWKTGLNTLSLTLVDRHRPLCNIQRNQARLYESGTRFAPGQEQRQTRGGGDEVYPYTTGVRDPLRREQAADL